MNVPLVIISLGDSMHTEHLASLRTDRYRTKVTIICRLVDIHYNIFTMLCHLE